MTINPQRDQMQMLLGVEAFEWMRDREFLESWDSLYDECPWATVFQSRKYVHSWYLTFNSEYAPLLVFSYDPEGKLDGLLTMTLSKAAINYPKSVKIMGAGLYDAEYQVWLASEENEHAFIDQALGLIWGKFPKADIIFRYIPKGTLVSSFENSKNWKKRCVIQPFRRPLMKTQSSEISNIISPKGQYKTKFKKLGKLKGYSFRKITEQSQFEEILPQIIDQFDFRQAAMFNKSQFRESPQKINFYLRLFKEGLLHVTVIMVHREVLASMVALHGKKWVHLQGINTHSPIHSKLSPGMLHFYLLAERLVEERVDTFDLTPGWDTYKEMWMTESDTVFSLVATRNSFFYFKKKAKKYIYDLILKMGLRPMSVEMYWEKRKYLLKKKGLSAFVFGEFNASLKKENAKFYIENRDSNVIGEIPFRKNSLNDLLKYDSGKSMITRWELMERAMFCLGGQCNLYTHTNRSQLLVCVQELKDNNELTRAFSYNKDSVFLELIYCHQDQLDQIGSFILSVINRIEERKRSNKVYLIADKRNRELCKALESSNFEPAVSE
ncbi:GNAT family N-acetyltransferase [Echinicola shivajiensis]|uniref:GNAT family N-acetyltransferase n=1 Tax=Echinicola shivajiensis TaxID=1035916 RepID=UPI001BFC82D5|nr:GNAT family N-acetyltransferase [Echinicola shivajiensis]